MPDDKPPLPPIKYGHLKYEIGTTLHRRSMDAAGRPTIPATTILGEDTQTGQQITIDDVSRFSGSYVIGTQGVGKSSLLESMIYQDIAKNYAVIVLDPHGQLIENIISRMSKNQLHRAYFLDLTDRAYPFGFNIFSCANISDEHERNITRDRVMSMFEKVWPSETRGLLLPMLLQMVTDTLIEHAKTMTMADITALLLDADYRAGKVRKLKNKRLREYWELEYGTNSVTTQRRETAPLRTRLNTWLHNPIIRNIICQKEATIDFRKAIENHEILLIKLPVREQGYKTAAEVIGTMILTQISAATFSFSDTPETTRPGYSLYIDEFQNFVSDDTATLFTEGRKYKVRQTLAHQTRTQLTLKKVSSATLTANTVIAFRLEPDDAPDLARKFTDIDLFPQIHIPRAGILTQISRHKNKAVTDFWSRYIRRWQDADNKEIKRRSQDGERWIEYPRENLGFGIVEFHRHEVQAALSICEQIFYEAMLHKELNEDLGQQLMNIVAGWYTPEQEIQFTKHLAAAITALMNEPIAEKEKTDRAAIEDHLIHLENRHALASLSQKTYSIKSLPLISGVSASETSRRIAIIQEQTRKKYCRPREDVEAELADNQAVEPLSDNLQKLASPNPTLAALAQIRHDIEKPIKALYEKLVPENAKATKPGLNGMVQILRRQNILDESLTKTLLEIIPVANKVIHGDAVEPENTKRAISLSHDAIEALNRLIKSPEDTSERDRFEDIE